MNDDQLAYFKRELYFVIGFLGVGFIAIFYSEHEVPTFYVLALSYLGIILGLVGGIAIYGASPYREYCYPLKNKLLALLFIVMVASWLQRWFF